MIGLDTNILVRFLTGDDSVQSKRVSAFLTAPNSGPFFINMIVLIETVWVLRRLIRTPNAEIASVLELILRSPDFVVQSAEMVSQALQAAGQANCDLADALIAMLNENAGCSSTVTFDTKAQRLAHMVALEEFNQ